jgi:hypothetical protein
LSSSATIYFAGNSTFTISTFTVNGSSSYPSVLKSTSTSVWYLNNTATNTVSYVQVQYSSASAGQPILAGYNSTDLGNNTNWVFSVNTPTNLQFSSATSSSLSATWTAPTPAGTSYLLQVSTASDFTGTITSSNTALVTATTTATLSANTTYYGRVAAIIANSTSAWTASVTTATATEAASTAASVAVALILIGVADAIIATGITQEGIHSRDLRCLTVYVELSVSWRLPNNLYRMTSESFGMCCER